MYKNFCTPGGVVERQKPPKDGIGPKGVPESYHTYRALESTFRYEKFIKKLRQQEEEDRVGDKIRHDRLQAEQGVEFFIRNDRRSLINDVARRVDLCMASYQNDLKRKRERLSDLLLAEEEQNVREFVRQAQSGAELIWQKKKDRLNYLLEKRQKEHEEKFKEIPLSKCSHAITCMFSVRAKQAQEIQKYQMKENQAMRQQQREFDKMWHEVAMKEADALSARLELDELERKRREVECGAFTQAQLEQRRRQREIDRELLKKEAQMFRSVWEEDQKKEDELERERREKRASVAADCQQMLRQRREAIAKKKAEDKLVESTWSTLTGASLEEDRAAQERRKQVEIETNICNNQLIKLRDADVADETLRQKVAKQAQDELDKKRCEYILWSQKQNREVRSALVDQIKDRAQAKERLKEAMKEEETYQNEVYKQMDELCNYKLMEEALVRKKHQQNLIEQIEYNKLLKERALQEEREQREKARIANEEYEAEINRMMCRKYQSDFQHPFVKQMNMNYRICPCSKDKYCKVQDKPGTVPNVCTDEYLGKTCPNKADVLPQGQS